MAKVSNPQLEKVYSATSPDEQRESYDAWADDYERDLFRFGIRLQANAAAVFAAWVPDRTGPFLDAACGTGLQIEPLALLGYGPFIGVDLSERMLAVAGDKNLYETLMQATLGERLPFDDDAFAASLCIGAMVPGHAPPETFEELARVTCPGGLIVVTLRVDDDADEYHAALADHETNGRLQPVFQCEPFVSMPFAEPTLRHTVVVLEVVA